MLKLLNVYSSLIAISQTTKGVVAVMEKDIEELRNVCEPVLEYLRNKHPYYKVTISSDFIKLEETVIGIPVSEVCDECPSISPT